MTDLDWGKIIAVFISCALKPGIAGIPAALLSGFTFWETLIVCGSGGIFGTVVFSLVMGTDAFNAFIDAIVKGIEKLLDKLFPRRNKKRKKFNRTNRLIIRSKRSFGMLGIAIIAPILLSIPLGVFLAIRFYDDRKRTILWMSASVLFWTNVLYLLYYFFGSTFKRIF